MHVANYAMLSNVRRWVTVRTIQNQSVAEHSFNVAWIYIWLCKITRRGVSVQALKACLAHDLEEGFTGDIPAPAMPSTLDLDNMDREEFMVAIADQLDAWLFLRLEMGMGNTSISSIMMDVRDKMDHLIHKSGIKLDPPSLRQNLIEAVRQRTVSTK